MNLSISAQRDLKKEDFETIEAVNYALRRFDHFSPCLPISAVIEFPWLHNNALVAHIKFLWNTEIFETFSNHYGSVYRGEGFLNPVPHGSLGSLWNLDNAAKEALRVFLNNKLATEPSI